MRSTVAGVLGFTLAALAACEVTTPGVESTVPAGCAEAPAVTWDNWGHGFFLTWCNSCHSAATPDRRGAPVGVDFDTWAQVQAQRDRVVARVLDADDMPVGGGLYGDDRAALEVLLLCPR